MKFLKQPVNPVVAVVVEAACSWWLLFICNGLTWNTQFCSGWLCHSHNTFGRTSKGCRSSRCLQKRGCVIPEKRKMLFRRLNLYLCMPLGIWASSRTQWSSMGWWSCSWCWCCGCRARGWSSWYRYNCREQGQVVQDYMPICGYDSLILIIERWVARKIATKFPYRSSCCIPSVCSAFFCQERQNIDS